MGLTHKILGREIDWSGCGLDQYRVVLMSRLCSEGRLDFLGLLGQD
jgi:hypothetical protein